MKEKIIEQIRHEIISKKEAEKKIIEGKHKKETGDTSIYKLEIADKRIGILLGLLWKEIEKETLIDS